MIIMPQHPGDTRTIVQHLDRQFERQVDWAVLHGLQLPVAGHAVRVDHLLINDFLECVCIDSRYLKGTLVPRREGGFGWRHPDGETRIGSPLGKAARQARLLAGALDQRRRPRWVQRLRIAPRLTMRSLVLHDPAGLSDAERAALPADGALVAGTEALHALLQRQRRRRARHPFARVPPTRLHAIARTIARAHRSAAAPSLPITVGSNV